MNKEDLKLMNEIAWEYEFKLESVKNWDRNLRKYRRYYQMI